VRAEERQEVPPTAHVSPTVVRTLKWEFVLPIASAYHRFNEENPHLKMWIVQEYVPSKLKSGEPVELQVTFFENPCDSFDHVFGKGKPVVKTRSGEAIYDKVYRDTPQYGEFYTAFRFVSKVNEDCSLLEISNGTEKSEPLSLDDGSEASGVALKMIESLRYL
jgi:hypothetical protein